MLRQKRDLTCAKTLAGIDHKNPEAENRYRSNNAKQRMLRGSCLVEQLRDTDREDHEAHWDSKSKPYEGKNLRDGV